MSAYKGHRGPNVSQYVANLNQLSPPQGLLDEPAPSEEDFSAFLNTDFFDVNNGPIAGFDSHIDLDADLATEQSAQPNLGNSSRKQSVHASAAPNMEFNLNGKYRLSLFPFFHCVGRFVLRCTQSGRNGRILFAARRPMAMGQGA